MSLCGSPFLSKLGQSYRVCLRVSRGFLDETSLWEHANTHLLFAANAADTLQLVIFDLYTFSPRATPQLSLRCTILLERSLTLCNDNTHDPKKTKETAKAHINSTCLSYSFPYCSHSFPPQRITPRCHDDLNESMRGRLMQGRAEKHTQTKKKEAGSHNASRTPLSPYSLTIVRTDVRATIKHVSPITWPHKHKTNSRKAEGCVRSGSCRRCK